MRGTGASQDCSPAPHGQELTPTHCSFSSHYSEYFTMSLMDTAPHHSSNTHHPKKTPHSKFLGPHSLPCPWSCFRRDWTPPSLLTRGGDGPTLPSRAAPPAPPQAQAACPRGNFSIFHRAFSIFPLAESPGRSEQQRGAGNAISWRPLPPAREAATAELTPLCTGQWLNLGTQTTRGHLAGPSTCSRHSTNILRPLGEPEVERGSMGCFASLLQPCSRASSSPQVLPPGLAPQKL